MIIIKPDFDESMSKSVVKSADFVTKSTRLLGIVLARWEGTNVKSSSKPHGIVVRYVLMMDLRPKPRFPHVPMS